MKKTYLMLITIACSLLAMVSCGHSPEKISKKEIIKEANRILKNSATYFVSDEIEIGTYECNDESEREFLRKLEAAGLITYNVERIAWWEKSFRSETKTYLETEYYWGYSYQVPKSYKQKKAVYNFEDHYIVTVALTEKGQKYVVNEIPKPINEDELKQPEIDPASYAWFGKDLSENWDEIKNPFIKEEAPKDISEEASTPVEKVKEESKNETKSEQAPKTPKSEQIERIDSKQYDKYKAFKNDIKKVRIKLFEIEACDARNIRIIEVDKVMTATAVVILCTTDVTDFARVACSIENDQKVVIPVTLTYFIDKGWVIENKSELVHYSAIDIFSDIVSKTMEEEAVVEALEEVATEEIGY